MNASDLRSIPLRSIQPSRTAVQKWRREHFDAAKLLELADSIKTQGVLQPILVRGVGPMIGAATQTQFELVAGERRWIAADRAGLTEIDCNVRELTDAQVIEAQLVENLQREDSDPLYEAEGYRELLTLKQVTAEELAALIGKSRAYVYARLKLLELCPEARAALDTGELDASKALLIARFKGPKLQQQALRRLGNSPQYPYQSAVDTLRHQFMADLTRAPFALDDAAFFRLEKVAGKRNTEESVGLPACVACPHYSRNDAELQASFDADAHVCTDRACYDVKVVAFHGRKREAALKAGRTVLAGEAAQAAIPDRYSGISAEYVDLDATLEGNAEFAEPEPDEMESPEWTAWRERADAWDATPFRKLLEAALADRAVLAEDKDGRLHELVPVKDAAKALKAKGIEIEIPKPRQQSLPAFDTEAMKREREKQEERQEREIELRRRVLAQIHAKWKGPLKRDDLAQVALALLDGGAVEVLGGIYPKEPVLDRMSEAELGRLIVLLSVCESVKSYRSPAPLFDMAKRLKIDPAKIKKDLAAEARAKDKPAAKPAKKKSRQ